MKNKIIIVTAIILALSAGCGIYYYLATNRHEESLELESKQEPEGPIPAIDTTHVAPDKEAWAAADSQHLPGLPKREVIDWNAEGAEYLPERPNQPVEVADEDIALDSEGIRYIVQDRINIMLDNDTLSMTDFASEFKRLYPSWEYEIIYADPIFRRLQVQVPDGERENVKVALVERFGENDVIVWDEAIMASQMKVNDRDIDSCWYHSMVHTYNAWDITCGSSAVVVAVLDDGFELNHEDLKGKSIKPYNVYTRDGDVSELESHHGTHVAGIILAEANNGIGMAGVAPKCSLMPIKVYDSNGNCTFSAMMDAILYAVYNRADVVNISLETMWGDSLSEMKQNELIRTHFKAEERIWKSIFATANRNHTTVVIAAGNENVLAGIEPMQRSENVIVVAAVDANTESIRKSDYSNWGRYTDVSAPGRGIYGTVGKNDYACLSGTSFAAPIVSGAVALMKTLNDELTTKQILTILERTGLQTKGRVGRLIQIDEALLCVQDNILPPSATQGSLQILLNWNDKNDLDLYCTDPSGERIYYRHRKAKSGGELEIDMNVKEPYCNIPIENIFWQDKAIPKGKYEVAVSFFSQHDENSESDFEVIVRHGYKERRYYGTAKDKTPVKVCEFEVN